MAEYLFLETQEVPEHKHAGFPRILSPDYDSRLSSLPDCIRARKAFLESLLAEAGAVLFRGFPVNSAHHFNQVVEAFGWEDFHYVGGNAPRVHVLGRVYTANEAPPDQNITFHHELAQAREYPGKLLFYCETEPRSGGETPLVDSHMVYQRMKERHPEFVARLEEEGLIYMRIFGDEDDLSFPIGRSWKSAFFTDDREVAHHRAAALGMKLEWIQGGVRATMGPIEAVKSYRTRKLWFNNMVAAYTGWHDTHNQEHVRAVTFADGTPLPPEVVADCVDILDQESVAIPWKKGDVLVIDNMAVLHGRRSFHPPRRILAALCK